LVVPSTGQDPRPTIGTVTTALVELVAPIIDDLANEDPAVAVEAYFDPLRVRSLPAMHLSNSECSIDGYYETNLDPARPWILYADDVSPARARFTILHELGHHLVATIAERLLDDLDVIGGSPAGAIQAEEAVCRRFAGRVLIPQHLVDAEVEAQSLRPEHVIELHNGSHASWEAAAVRAAEAATTKAAVLLIREPGEIAFTATSSRMPNGRWPRGSHAQPDGALARALGTERQRAIKDIYRWNLAFAEQLYCDTTLVHDHLAVAVLSERPSDKRFDILENVEPSWKEKEEFCLRCGDERNIGWCDTCRGRRCRSCGSCGCNPPVENPLCPNCFLHNPFRPGATICRDCELELG
jgi:IrrE N-terminal-like domain